MDLETGDPLLAFPFLSLPEKPLAEIIKFLKPDDLRNLRLVNHQLLTRVDGTRDTIRLSRNEIRHEHDLIHIIANWHRWPKLKVFEAFKSYSDALQGLENAAWADLEYLDLANCRLGEAEGIGLATAAKHWRRLRVLNLAYNHLTANAVIALSEVLLPLLGDLNLSKNEIGPAIGAALANGAPQWPSLRKLDLCNVELDDAGLEALLSARFPLLEDVDLSGNQLQLSARFVFVNAATQWPNLRVLDLSDNQIPSLGWQRLATNHFDKLEQLSIGSTDELELDPAGVRALREGARHWPRLRAFELVTFEELDIRGLFKEGGWEALEYLALGGGSFGHVVSQELKDAVSSQQLPSLKRLDLSTCNYVDGDFLESLFEFPWPILKALYIDDWDEENNGMLWHVLQ